MESLRNSNNKSGKDKGNYSRFASILACALLLATPNLADAQNTSSLTRNGAEISTSTILDMLNQKIGVSLPDEYNQKVLNFVLNDTIMRTKSATAYTEDFIINEMKKDRGISKQNQLLFIWSKIYEGISQTKLYKLIDDSDMDRRSEYKKSLRLIANCYDEYEKGFKSYMETGIAEADRRSAEADRRSAEALNSALENIVRFYNRYKKDPSSIKSEEVKQRKEKGKQVVQGCMEFGIDYKAKLSPEMLKFYGIE